MTYLEFVENKIQDYDFGTPIYISTLASALAEDYQLPVKAAAAAVSVAVKRLIDSRSTDLRSFQKGIYYRAKKTPFGETGIQKDTLIADKYLAADNGYETGFSLLYRMGLSTQIPAKRAFATNKASRCIREDKVLEIYICPPKIRVDAENKLYLQVLDAIETMGKAPVDAEHPYHLLAEHIHKINLDYRELLSLAGKYYGRNTVLTLARIAGERN